MQVILLGNYTLDFLSKELNSLSIIEEIDLDIIVSGYNQYRKYIIDFNSQTYKTHPEIIFISLDLTTLLENIFYEYSERLNKERIDERIDESLDYINILANKMPNTMIFIDNFYLFHRSVYQTLNYNIDDSYGEIETYCNTKLKSFINPLINVKIVDIRDLIIRYGLNQMIDYRLHYTAKSHWSFKALKEIAKLYLRYIKAFIGKRKKCIVLDLDNTLWGGIIGEVGSEGIELSNDGPGKAFYDFQNELKKLYDLGIILAINSKNTEEIALATIKEHPYMILKPDYFLVKKINWKNKIENIKEIAEEINIGYDSIVFLDDSPYERDIVKSYYPQIETPELPKDSSLYPKFIRELEYFDFLNVTKDDTKRNQSYRANIKRNKYQHHFNDIEKYYYSLEMIATISKACSFSIPRIAQMTQKTNQFNLTTYRYTENDINKFSEDINIDVYYLRLEDKFGDNGIIGTAVIRQTNPNKVVHIDSFLISCRVIGRTVETVFINEIINYYKKMNYHYLTGEYIPTKRNKPCKDFYKDHKFKYDGKYWVYDMKNNKTTKVPWMKVESKLEEVLK